MTLWFLDEDGRPHRRRVENYHPAFYAAGPPAALDRLSRDLARRRLGADLRPAVRQELFSGDEVPVTQVAVHRPLHFPAAVRQAATIPALTLYTCDLSAAQLFLYESGLFPLGRYEVAAADGALREAIPLTRPEDLEYEPPPLLVMRLRLDGDPINPNHGWRGELEVAMPGEHVVLGGERPEDLCRSLNRLLTRYDPDVLLTDWGDPFLIPRLLRLSAQAGVPIAFNRDPRAGIGVRRGRSYVTYGKTVYQAGAHILAGRWHLDLRNSFIYAESEMAGLLEIARLARLPVQRLARTSTGTAISSMQLARAVQRGILVPWHKSEPEGFKSAAELLITDKGGLTYQPLVGVYEGVGELDFSSMYPTIMARFNVSPETINCVCCENAEPVPEIGHTICQRRRGLVPQVLDHLLERRAYYKRRKLQTHGAERTLYNQRQTALKWMLVVSFGFLGYRNARYGRIEAHESTTAYSREMLLRAKEVAETQGYRMLHAIVDSMWLQKPGADHEAYEALARDIEHVTNLPVAVEGVYGWVSFLPSKTHPGVGVPNRYLGVFENGETKVRGIEVRRSDTPVLIEEMQARMLQEMFAASTIAALLARLPRVLAVLEETLVRLREGSVRPGDLALTTTISQEVSEYRSNHPVAVAARAMAAAGVRLHPGEAIQYVITDADAKLVDERVRPLALLGADWAYDHERYAELLLRAAETVLEPFGYTVDRLREEVWLPVSGQSESARSRPERATRSR
ncbi:MAG: DNA polymerase domain-containing protein [bacterium]